MSDEPEFVPWQDAARPVHHGEEARYRGTVGERELRAVAGDGWFAHLRDHLVDGAEHLEPEFVAPDGGQYDSLIHWFECRACGEPLYLWDAN